jgi:hypothetical protein
LGIIDDLKDIAFDTAKELGERELRRRLGLDAGTSASGIDQCPPGTFRFPGTDSCVAPGDAFPGGDPFTFQAGGPAGIGPLGLYAQPAREQVTTLRCPPGLVLAMDDLCYDSGSLPKKFRKWRPASKPAVSGYDKRMMKKYGVGGTKAKAVKKLASAAGFTCKQKGSKKK